LAGTLNNLAASYHAEGRYAEAEKLFRRSLSILEKSLGPDHPSVVAVLDNLANLYASQGKRREAEKMETRASALRARRPE